MPIARQEYFTAGVGMASVLFDPVEQGVFLCDGNYLDHRLANIKIKTFNELISLIIKFRP
jgi:hypothetical protein